jgi:hypothetical protein
VLSLPVTINRVLNRGVKAEIVMQEDQTVAFQPIYEGYLPWYSKLFLIYLFVVLAVILVRIVKFVWNLLRLRKLQRAEGHDSSQIHLLWTKCYAKAHSLRGLAILTFLLSLLDFSWWTSDILRTVRTAKTPGLAYILQAVADALAPFSIGILFCVVLYVCAVFGEQILNASGSHFQPGPPQSNRAY